MAHSNQFISMVTLAAALFGFGCTYNTYTTVAGNDDAGEKPTTDASDETATDADTCTKTGPCPVLGATLCNGGYVCCATIDSYEWKKGTCTSAPASVTTPPQGDASIDDTATATDVGTDTASAVPAPTMTPPVVDSGTTDTGTTPAPTTTPTVADSGTVDSAPADTGTTDTGTADTGTATPPATPMVSLAVHARAAAAGNHVISLYDFSSWPNFSQTVTGTGIDVTRSVPAGSKFVLNGQVDGSWAFVNYLTGRPLVTIWATVDGKPAGRVTAQKNSKGDAYDLVFIASPAATATNDQDGDGFTTDSVDPSLRDCNDNPSANGNAFYPGQIETKGDTFDYDCNGFADPPGFIIRMTGVAQGFSPLVYDAARWPSNLPMIWNQAVNAFDSYAYDADAFPSEFMIAWTPSLWSTSQNSSGSCVQNVPLQVFNNQTGALVTVTAAYSTAGSSCHQFATLPAP